MICDRCLRPSGSWKMSRFNTEDICPVCQKEEEAHPDYAEAARVELEAVKRGDYNYPGVGKPLDL